MYLCVYYSFLVLCSLCVALARMYHVWYNRSAVHSGRGWPNIITHTQQDVKRKHAATHNLHNSFTHPATVGSYADYVEICSHTLVLTLTPIIIGLDQRPKTNWR